MKNQQIIWAFALIATGIMMAALLAMPASEDTEKTGFQGRLEGFSIVLGGNTKYHIADTASCGALTLTMLV